MSKLSDLSSCPERFASLFLGCIIIIYIGLSCYQINLPGLHYDEAFETVPMLQLLRGQPVTTFRNHGLTVGGQTFPLMTQDYIGAINTYLSLPFIAILGATPAALRIMSIIVGAITLWLAYALSSQLTGHRWVGLVAAFLLSVDPTFVFWNRQGIFVTAVTAPIGLAATLCWLKYSRDRSIGWALAGSFLLGLGIYAKFLFVWLVAALTCAAVLLNWGQFATFLTGQRNKSEHLWKNVAWIALTFLLGCWPLILYNIQTGGGTILSITQNAGVSYYGVNNLAFGANLLERLKQFTLMVNGQHFWYFGHIWGTSLPSFLFLGLLVFVVSITTRNINPNLKIAFLPFLVIGLTILFSIGTVSALWVTHFALLMPWPNIAVAIGNWYILSSTSSRSIFRATVLGLLLLLLGNQLITTIRYHVSLTESGGLSSHSDAIYHLSDWLSRYARGPVAAMDWGLAAPVVYLTGGQVTPVEVFGYTWESDAELTHRLESLISQSDTLYLWRAPDEIIFDRSQEFKQLYRPRNLEENIEAAFYERSGRPLLGVTRLVEKGSAENPPQ
ncbi:MAG: glycosyltransferase family 39 protein [Anaerolineae bacterium]|nr:glycosyltransferase family 39 protein [Anaerolineae bacterium]